MIRASRKAKNCQRAWIGALLIGLAVPCMRVQADSENRPAFEITPFGGYRLSGSFALDDASYKRLDFADAGVYGIAMGINVAPPEGVGDGAVEVMWTHQDSALTAQPNPGVTSTSMDMNVDQFLFN